MSTRNPDHLLAFFNDYRAVDIPDDTGLGELEQLAMLFNTSRLVLAAIPWLQPPQISVPPIAAAEAWVGMSRSYDGGLTWSGGFLPGGPFDDSPASLASPIYGLEAATDPVVVPGPSCSLMLKREYPTLLRSETRPAPHSLHRGTTSRRLICSIIRTTFRHIRTDA